jgi:hypothetical protein
MDDYLYATLGADRWFRCDRLHRSGFPILLWDVLHHFSYMGLPTYHGRPYHQFGLGRCKVHVDIPAHSTDPTMTAWFTTAQGDDIDDTLERAAHQALTEFCKRHLPVLGDTAIALLPVRNKGNTVWSERVAAIGDPKLPFHHAGWAFTACYAQHVNSLLQEVTATAPSPVPPSGGVHRSGEGQEPRRQGHPEGQLRASAEERPPRDAHQRAE